MIVGIDIGHESSQICYYDSNKKQPEQVSVVRSGDNSRQYLFAFKLSGAESKDFEELIRTLLSLLPENADNENKFICVTVRDFSKKVLDNISEAMLELGFLRRDFSVLSYEESYAYYAFSQKKELYANGVMLLDYGKDGLYTHYMTIVKKNGFEIIPEESRIFNSEAIISGAKKEKKLMQIENELVQCIHEAFRDKIISAVYLTGEGFEGEALPKELTHLICAHRKAFAGQNLFVKGAVYCGIEQEKSDTVKDDGRILACRNRITTGLEFTITERGEKKRFRMVKPGTNWYEADRTVEFILEDIRTIPVTFKTCDGSEEWEQLIDISSIPFRAGKMTRVSVSVSFESDSRCKLIIRDLGFGSFEKNSGAVVEKEIEIDNRTHEVLAKGIKDVDISNEGAGSGKMILCRTGYSETPYCIEDMGIEIYSLEELCYYIYNNIYILTNEFLNEKLIEFISDKTGERSLASRLLQLKGKNNGLAQAVITILKYVDYYDVSEIEKVEDLLNMLDTQNIYERIKMRADSFLENGCYYSAINNYDKIIKGERDTSLSGLFYAKVYHNIGTAYARMFFFKKAAEYFKEAYKIGQHEESERSFMAARRLAMGEEFIEDMQAAEDESLLYKDLERFTANARYSDEYRNLLEIDNLKAEGEVAGYYKAIDDCMDKWKAQYQRYTS